MWIKMKKIICPDTIALSIENEIIIIYWNIFNDICVTEITFIRSVIEVYINFVPCIFQTFLFGIKCVCVISEWVVVV